MYLSPIPSKRTKFRTSDPSAKLNLSGTGRVFFKKRENRFDEIIDENSIPNTEDIWERRDTMGSFKVGFSTWKKNLFLIPFLGRYGNLDKFTLFSIFNHKITEFVST